LKGHRPYSPFGKVALMFLKHFAGCSDNKFIEHLFCENFNERERLKNTACLARCRFGELWDGQRKLPSEKESRQIRKDPLDIFWCPNFKCPQNRKTDPRPSPKGQPERKSKIKRKPAGASV